VAGTINEAIHYAVFSNFLLISAIKSKALSALLPNPVYRLSSMSQNKYHTHIYDNTR